MSRTKTTVIAVLVLAVTFVAGAVVGIFADRIFHRGHGAPEFATHMLVRRLSHHLDLNDAQRKKVTEIIDRHHARINSFYGTIRPRVREEVEQANREIEALLTPEQRAKFEKLKMHLGHPPRGRRPGTERTVPTR
ncbi:MAG TPA: hypothetical protein VJZ00_02025 [Thermoanaerobaculia bacterium]|nr:hypothetical protein [Thermoanaerobaculia bacterium]